MQRLWIFREKVKTFIDQHSLIFRCIVKFLGAMISPLYGRDAVWHE